MTSTLWCLAIVAAPVWNLVWIYRFFSIVCHQVPERSWQMFGASLPVCIRCASVYFAFSVSLWLGLRGNIVWFRIGLLLMLSEFVIARVLVDSAALRSFAGIFVGLTAAPFVKQGVEELCDFL